MRVERTIPGRRTALALGAAMTLGVGAPAVAQESASGSAPPRAPDVHFVPTRMEVVNAMLGVARVGPKDVVYDLGCGDGRIVITAAKRHGARGLGVDIDPVRIKESRHNADTAGVTRRVSFRQGDLFEMDLSEASVVTLYLLPSLNLRLLPKLYQELRPGTRIVSNSFDMGDWRPDSTVAVEYDSGLSSSVHYWVLPADVSGEWTVTVEGRAGASRTATPREYRMRLRQRYQQVMGTVSADGTPLPVESARLVGDRLRLTVWDRTEGEPQALRFAGRIAGSKAEGTVEAGGRRLRWTAVRTEKGAGPVPEDRPE